MVDDAPMFLDKDEISALAGKKTRTAQARVLNALGITHKMRPDGSLVVLRSHVETVLGGKLTSREREKERQSKQEAAWNRQFEANLEAMRVESEEWARKRKAQQDAKRERTNQERKRRGLDPLE